MQMESDKRGETAGEIERKMQKERGRGRDRELVRDIL
jgi:hypothetical protein